jgi:aryl-alcohol dehydrogenase-like predicted oxidoreductase
VEQSLRRMKTDHLDLVQFHAQPTVDVLEAEGSIAVLQELQQQGKIRFIGMSSTLPVLADHVAMGVFDAFQIPYSAVQREHEQIIATAAAGGAGIVIRGGAARGAPAPDKEWTQVLGQPQGVAQDRWIAADMDTLLEEAGMSRMEFTVRFTLSHPDMHTTIIGTRNPVHLQQNVEWAARGALPADLYAEACRRLPGA